MKRTPLKRRRLWAQRWRGPREDPVTDELMAALRRRDHGCVAAQVLPGHLCRDRFGNIHAWDDWRYLTPEHFREDYAVKGDRAPSDLEHTVLLCAATNIGAPSKLLREKFRAWVIERNR